MQQRKSPWKSRKFWAAVILAVVMLINHYTGIELDPEAVLAIVLPVVAWIIGEAVVDATRKKE